MVKLESVIERFDEKGDKTGWRYILIPQSTAQKIKPNFKKSFRVKGYLDNIPIKGMATVPIGEGDFILALKQSLRKQLSKNEGDLIIALLEEDKDFKIETPDDLLICLQEEQHLWENFEKLAPSHQGYFIKYITDSKTSETRFKRITMVVNAMDKNWDYGKMIRESRSNKF